jgi:hypothetical protein
MQKKTGLTPASRGQTTARDYCYAREHHRRHDAVCLH